MLGKGGEKMRRLVWAAMGACIAAVIGVKWPYAMTLLFGAGVVASVVLFSLRNRKRVFCAALWMALGLWLGLGWFLLYEGVFLAPARMYTGEQKQITLEVTRYPEKRDDRFYVEGNLRLQGHKVSTGLYCTLEDEMPKPGDRVQIVATLYDTARGGEKGPNYLRGSGIKLVAYGARNSETIIKGKPSLWTLPAELQHQVCRSLEKYLPKERADFCKALLVGDKSGISYGQRMTLSVVGISHIMAVSGMHLGILFALVYCLTLRRRVLSCIVGIPVLFLFAAVVGGPPSVLRASIMLGLALLARLLGRDYDSPTALAVAVLGLLFANPFVIESLSFQLSVAAVAGILCFTQRLNHWFQGKLPKGKRIRAFSLSISVTLGATIFTMPICAYTFDLVSLVAPLTNVLVLWAVSLVFYGAMAVCVLGLVWEPAAFLMGKLVSMLIAYIVNTAKFLARFPFSAIYPEENPYAAAWIVFFLVLLGVFLLGGCRYKKRLVAALGISLALSLALGCIEPRLDRFRVAVLDVGQGECVVLQSQGKTYVVDCGGSEKEGAGETATRYLMSQGITHINGLVVTHYDLDHISGVPHLLDRMDVGRVYVPKNQEESQFSERITRSTLMSVDNKILLDWNGGNLTIFPPLSQKESNDSGLSVLFTVGEYDTLVTGDMSQSIERKLISMYPLPDVELLVAGHHGSKYSTGSALLHSIMPDIVAISVGPNSYGHPSKEVLDRLAQQNIPAVRTDQCGTIIIRG